MNEADVLEEAANLIHDVGHVQGDYYGIDTAELMLAGKIDLKHATGFCAIGAIRAAAGFYDRNIGDPVSNEILELTQNAATALAERVLGQPGVVIDPDLGAWNVVTDWNDQQNRTATEVIEMMKQTAKDLRNTAA